MSTAATQESRQNGLAEPGIVVKERWKVVCVNNIVLQILEYFCVIRHC